METEYKLFQEIELHGKRLNECELVYEGRFGDSRMYIERDESAFYSHAVRFVGLDADESNNLWEGKSLVVETLFESTAYFDGVRHLEFNRNGTDMDGYIYYPHIEDFVGMLAKLRELELEICWDAEK